MKKSIKYSIYFSVQKVLLIAGFWFLQKITKHTIKAKSKWIVGVEEIAGIMKNVSSALDNAVTVSIKTHPFYSFTYSYNLNANGRIRSFINTLFIRPVLLAWLMCNSDNFIYIGAKGFLSYSEDGREFEFNFLVKNKKNIYCIFTGSDIRSIEKSIKQGIDLDRDVMAVYLKELSPVLATEEKETALKQLCTVSEKYANFIINSNFDQLSYFTKKTLPFLYFCDDNFFCNDDSKFSDLSNPIILHAPSSPFIKGTQLVRAAIKLLKEEGYRFTYRELIRVPHEEVISALKQSHIVLNEFYAFSPGVFGIEAMANSCCLLTSADPLLDITLPENASDAWIVTPYWMIYNNLKSILDNKDLIAPQAKRGHKWCLKHCSYTNSITKFREYISEN